MAFVKTCEHTSGAAGNPRAGAAPPPLPANGNLPRCPGGDPPESPTTVRFTEASGIGGPGPPDQGLRSMVEVLARSRSMGGRMTRTARGWPARPISALGVTSLRGRRRADAQSFSRGPSPDRFRSRPSGGPGERRGFGEEARHLVASLISEPDRVYATSPDGGPDWGARALATFLFPKK